MSMAKPPTWRARDRFPLTRENLIALFANEIPEIHIPAFASPAECASFVDAMTTGNIQTTPYSRIGYIGAVQANHRWGGNAKADYFASTEQAWRDLADVTGRSWNPLDRMMGMLQDTLGCPVGVAEEPDAGRFFAGVVKLSERPVARHVDFAPLNMPGWHIAEIEAQIGWNLFLTAPDAGGSTTVWNAPWTVPIVPGAPPPQSYGLGDEWVEGAETWTYAPVAGDVVLFNTRNPHRVDASSEGSRRWQTGSFVGRRPDGSLVVWS